VPKVLTLTSLDQIRNDAHAVLLPAIDSPSLPDHIAAHLDAGGTSVLVGESREEYVSRSMSLARRTSETVESFAALTSHIHIRAGGQALVAVDQEMAGIQRLEHLVSPLPTAHAAVADDNLRVEQAAVDLSRECVALGVNVVLSPIVDVVTGVNPWLEGRTVSADPATSSRVACEFVRGLQRSGRVSATAKHFPGHPNISKDPAIEADAEVDATLVELEPTLATFRAVVEVGVKIVMTGPALVPAIDPLRAASRSAGVVGLLRDEIGFSGVVLSDDLDSAAVLRGGTLEDAAIDALEAGVDWLLVPGGPGLEGLVDALVTATQAERLSPHRLGQAARTVRSLAEAGRT
jgi:beta-N-acetylhexosaminidase